MPELDLHRSLSEIAYAAGVASHPERVAELRGIAGRRRRRRTALVAAGSAVVVAATAVGALALSPIGDDSTQPVTPPSTDNTTVTTPSQTPTPTETPSPQVTGLAADPFLPDSEVHPRFGAQYGASVGFDEPEWECTFPGLDATGARGLALARWQEEPAGGSLSEYVMQFDSPAAADAAVSMTGDVWEMCRMPTLEFGGELAGPTAVAVGDEGFRYTADIGQTADVVAQHQEVAIGRRGNVVVLLDVIWVGTTPPTSALGLLDGLLPVALDYSTGTVTASPTPPARTLPSDSRNRATP